MVYTYRFLNKGDATMNIFQWIYMKLGRPKKDASQQEEIAIKIPTIITPEKIYEDCIETIKEVTPKKHIWKKTKIKKWEENMARKLSEIDYLKDDVRRKIGQQTIYRPTEYIPIEGKPGFPKIIMYHFLVEFVIDTVAIKIARGEVHEHCLSRSIDQISYEEFLRHEKLPQIIELVMETPFLVMIVDLEPENEVGNQSWYQKLKRKIAKEREEANKVSNLTLNDEQKIRVATIMMRLNLFEAELEKAAEHIRIFCKSSLDYIEKMRFVINEMVAQKRIELLEKNTHLLAQTAQKIVQEKYDILYKHALRVNASLKVFGVSDDIRLGELTSDALEKLEKGSIQLQTNLQDIQKVYFGEEIVIHNTTTA